MFGEQCCSSSASTSQALSLAHLLSKRCLNCVWVGLVEELSLATSMMTSHGPGSGNFVCSFFCGHVNGHFLFTLACAWLWGFTRNHLEITSKSPRIFPGSLGIEMPAQNPMKVFLVNRPGQGEGMFGLLGSLGGHTVAGCLLNPLCWGRVSQVYVFGQAAPKNSMHFKLNLLHHL